MSSRAEVPTTEREPEATPAVAHKVSVALIGPNNAHRKIVAEALAVSAGRTIHEIPSYPAKLSDVPQLMEQNFDVVMIDIDSDQSYALALVEKIAAYANTTVMVYSKRDDPQLLLNCMRAGAREFLPLPGDQEESSTPAVEEIEPPEPVGYSSSGAPAAEPAVPPQPNQYQWTTAETPKPDDVDAQQSAESGSEGPTPDFDEWDRMHLRALQSLDDKAHPEPPTGKNSASKAEAPKAENSSGPTSRSEKKSDTIGLHLVQPPPITRKIEPATPPKPIPATPVSKKIEEGPAATVAPVEPQPASEPVKTENDWDQVWARAGQPAGEAPSQAALPPDPKPNSQTWLEALDSAPERIAPPRPKFDPSMLEPLIKYEPEEKKHPSAVQWMILAMGLGVLVCLAVLYFFHPFGMNAAPTAAAKTATPQPAAAGPASSTVPATQTVESSAAAPSAVPSEVSDSDATPTPARRVSSAQMDAQLTAPAKISPAIKRTDEPPPPGGFTPAALDTGSTVPGEVFAGSSKVVTAAPSAISAGIAQGMLIHKTEPIYPPFAKQTHVGGTVSIGATVTKSGSLANLHVISGPAMLRESALQAVRTWKYRPYMLDNQPVEVQTTINVVFALDR